MICCLWYNDTNRLKIYSTSLVEWVFLKVSKIVPKLFLIFTNPYFMGNFKGLNFSGGAIYISYSLYLIIARSPYFRAIMAYKKLTFLVNSYAFTTQMPPRMSTVEFIQYPLQS